MTPTDPAASDRLWIPDTPDGSGWADVDWVSAARGSRYHYRHGAPWPEANAARPAFYRVVTRLESAALEPHDRPTTKEFTHAIGRLETLRRSL